MQSVWKQFVWNVKSYFLGKKITNLSSDELAQRVVKVNPDKGSILKIFFYFCTEGTHWNHLLDALVTSTYTTYILDRNKEKISIFFCWKKTTKKLLSWAMFFEVKKKWDLRQEVHAMQKHAWAGGQQIPRSACTVWSGPSLYSKRIIGYYRMCKWRAKAQMIFAHVQDDLRQYFALHGQNFKGKFSSNNKHIRK